MTLHKAKRITGLHVQLYEQEVCDDTSPKYAALGFKHENERPYTLGTGDCLDEALGKLVAGWRRRSRSRTSA